MSKRDKIELKELESLPEALDGNHRVIPIVTGEDDTVEEVAVPEILPVLTLRSSVLFPGAITPVTVGRSRSMTLVRDTNARNGMLAAVLQRDGDVEEPKAEDMYRIGTAARIMKILEMPNGNLTVILNGLEKVEIGEYVSSDPYLQARVTPLKDSTPDEKNVEFNALVDSIRDVALNIINISPNMPKEAIFAIKNIDSRRGIINFICTNLELSDEDRQSLLEAPGLLARARKLLEILIRDQQLIELKNEIQEKVKQEIDKQQRDYYLQQQMRTIQDELGDGADAELDEMREKAKQKNWPKEVAELFEKELQKLERLNPAVAEYSVQVTYLQLLLELPWNDCTKDNLDLKQAREQLDHDHFGLEEVKERLLEHLAVIKLKGDLKSPILCLYGPPGVGKTSLGKSVAAALGRKFGRIALGGLHDEAEIRGHRRTYIGAMPGRIVQTIKRCGSSNPVIILDEVDKISVSNHGDPSSALLEVLDPEQNTTFHDNYLDTEYDLSKVLFIATANNVGNINPALRDRMEMINIPGYILEDKIQIALHHLLPKQREAHGIKEQELILTPQIVEQIIAGYTRESGVRSLDKHIAKLARSRAKQIASEEAFAPELGAKEVEKNPRQTQIPQRGVRGGRHRRRGDGPRLDGSGRRHPLHRVGAHARQGPPEPHGQSGRRDEGVGHDRLRMGQGTLYGTGYRSREIREVRPQHPRARRRHSERRPVGRHHDGHVDRLDLHGPQGPRPHRHDGRNDAARPRNPRGRHQGEDTGRQARRHRDAAAVGGEPQGHRGDQARLHQGADVPLRPHQRRRTATGARTAGATITDRKGAGRGDWNPALSAPFLF